MVENKNLLEIRLGESDDFLKIKETLTRIGIANRKTKTLYQSAHILHKQGRYYIVHFKELYMLDGRESTLSNEDVTRRTAIALLLEQWGLCTLVNRPSEEEAKQILEKLRTFKIISHDEKSQWKLRPKYTIGIKHITISSGIVYHILSRSRF